MKAVSSNINFSEMENSILKDWEENGIFAKSNQQRRGKKEFSFYDGPPFANGLPHYGHLLANIIKDVVPRYWNMKGYFVERRFGWDCHGLPVEFEIEKREHLKGRADILAMGVDKFNELCRQSVLHYAAEWRKTISRLGRWVDWDNQYRTMDLSFMESVFWVFSELYKKGFVYRSFKVVPYSPRITAVLSNFEANQNYKEVQDPAVTLRFKLVDEDAYLLAWTTTPWTLISNLALTIGPQIEYARVKDLESGEVYYLAKDRVPAVFGKGKKKGGQQSYEIMNTLGADELLGRRYEPLFPYFKDHPNAFQVLAAEYVTTTEGTGIVHTAPGFGEDDFMTCFGAGIDLVDPLDEECRFRDIIPEYKGVYVKDADKDIIKDLKAKGLLVKHETIVHSYPFCERSDTPLIYRAIPAWYVAVEKIKELLVHNNQGINWVPEHLRDGRMGNWLKNARDWAISRNRFWGTPIPIWICDKDDEHRLCIGSKKELEDRTGTPVNDLHKHFIDKLTVKCDECGGTMKRIDEVFDCWFESGSMPYAQLHYPFENQEKFESSFPANFIAEGLDQTRGWFYTLCILSAALFGKPAFKNVVVNGLILASDGRKMSKRWRNYTPPEDLIETYGADSIRLYMLNSPVLKGGDLKFSNDGVKDTIRAVLLPLWNAYSFLSTYAHADDWQPDSSLLAGKPPKIKGELDRWIISRLQSLIGNVHLQMEAYRLYNVVPEVIGFIEDLTNWYIRLNRRRFWSESESISDDTREAYSTLYYVMHSFSKIFAPFAPFISEKIYQDLIDNGGADLPKSVHLCDMLAVDEDLIDRALEEKMALIRRITELGRSLRSKHQIKTRQVLAKMLIITRNSHDKEYIEGARDIIKNELNIKEIEFSTDEVKYVQLMIKPNLRTCGKKMGKKLKEFRDYLNNLNDSPNEIMSLIDKLEADLTVNILGFDLGRDDFLIERGPKDDRLIAIEGGVTVLLDTKLTRELILEGLAREFVNRIQKLRKDSNLNVSDRIQIELEVTDNDLREAINNHREYIAKEVLAVGIDVGGVKSECSESRFNSTFDIENASCQVGIAVVVN